jgi:mannose-6-phosphate isomerase-like protein (cupin superfamily)
MKEFRPWGYYKILSEPDRYKTKLIHVNPNNKLSYQKHKYRNEHWFIISGEAQITKNGEFFILTPGQSIDFMAGDLHRIGALDNPVEFIEIQTGTYFGEDDIERIEDDYGR